MTTWTEIAKLDAPASNVFDFPSLTLTGYTKVQVVASGLTVGTDDAEVGIHFYVGGVEITTTTYRWGTHGNSSGATGNGDGDTAGSGILLVSNDAGWGIGNDTGEAGAFVATIDQPLSTALHKKLGGEAVASSPSGAAVAHGSVAILQNTGAIDGLKVFGNAGTLTAGKVRILGFA